VPLRLGHRLRTQAPFLVVVGIVAAVFVYLTFAPGHWRRGTIVIALALLLGATMRIVLPERQAGFLRVRGRYLDTFCYAGLGVLILIVDLRLQ
jgi:membrane protease YdiL (CAAX protease family)